MRIPHARQVSRRRFLAGVTLAGTAGLLGLPTRRVAAEPPPETTRLRLHKTPGICTAPKYVAEALFLLEGFTEVHYLQAVYGAPAAKALDAGVLDITTGFVPPLLVQIDAGAPLVLLGRRNPITGQSIVDQPAQIDHAADFTVLPLTIVTTGTPR